MDTAERARGLPFLAGGGQLGALIESFDWSRTAVGTIDRWPAHMRAATALMLRSTVPIVMLWGESGVMIYNDAYSVFAGRRHPQLLGSKVREAWPEVADFNDNVMKVVLAGGTLSYQDQELALQRSGQSEAAWMNLDYSALLDDDGVPVGVMAIVVETTSKVRAEQRLQGEHTRLAQMFEQAPTFIAVLSGPEHRIELANPGYMRLVGQRPVLGRTVAEALPEAAAQGYVELLDQVYASGKAFAATSARYAFQAATGEPAVERFLDFVYQPMRDAAGDVSGIFVEGVDVTDRTESEHALRESELRLRALNSDLERQVEERSHERSVFWKLTSDLLGVLNGDGYFEKSNPAWSTVLGWSEDEVRATSIFELLHPADVEDTRGGFDRLTLGSPAVNFVNRYRCKDGSYRWLSWMGVPEDGKYYCSGRDITTEKEAQAALDVAQQALRQSQKMEAIGQLTGGIAHDFNNLLAGMSASLDLLQRRIEQGKVEDLGRYIAAAQKSARRAASLTHRLLAFSRQQTLDPRPVDVNKLIAGMEELIRRSVGPNVVVEVVGAGGLWSTKVDASQLESALLNLCINARDAMAPNGGRLTIETANKWLDDRAAKERDLPTGQYLSLCVSDTGSGMAPEVSARAFDPFYTTKPIGEGTGLGLSMVYGFARQSGGQVRIYSEVGQGTTMCLYFPRHIGAEETSEPETPHAPESGAGETILVVDDEPTLRMFIVEMLQESGYAAVDASDGASGLRILQSNARIDLLITDVGLPGGMNGRQVADAARLRRPGLKVLFITGFAENAVVGNGHLEAGMEVMTKPFEMTSLAGKVRELLDRR